MNIDAVYGNIKEMKSIVREMYIFTNQLEQIENTENNANITINNEEKKLLVDSITSLTNQLKILNRSLPKLVDNIGFYKKLNPPNESTPDTKKLIQVSYENEKNKERVSLVISENEKKEFIENLSKSNLSINQLKKKFGAQKPMATFGKPNAYAKLSNYFFRDISNSLVSKGYFDTLNSDLRRMNSQFVINTYISMALFTSLIALVFGVIFYIILLFFEVSILFPFLTPVSGGINILIRSISYIWVIFTPSLLVALIMYIYPSGEAKSLGARINQELPFISIHMSAIATSGVEPLTIFKIILRSDEYKNTKPEFTKLINLINFHGNDLVTALKLVAKSSPSTKLKELFDGMATTVTSGGNLNEFLKKHSESLLFDYKLEREKYTKTSETFMDIYISVVIAAPMVLLMLFVIMGSTGLVSTFLGLGVNELNLLLMLGIIVVNTGFLIFLKLKQPII